MTGAQENAVRALLAVLERENAALRSQRYDALSHTTTAKAAALRDLEGADAGEDTDDGEAGEERRSLARTLRATLSENRRLLKQGMDVQERIMALIAGAARREAVRGGYGARGAVPKQATVTAVALVTRA